MPIEQKRLLGNPGHQKLPEVKGTQPQLDVSRALEGTTGAFQSVLEHAQAWLGVTDAIAMALLNEMLIEREEIKRQVAQNEAPRRELRAIETHIMQMLKDLGLNPIARSKIGLSEVKAASTLETMRKQQR